jgi:hypothetical protein
MSPADLKKAVEKACGGLAREVKVTAGPDKTLTVRVVAHGSELEVMKKLLALPEMAAANVKLDLHLEP